jgi:hypothetical protein
MKGNPARKPAPPRLKLARPASVARPARSTEFESVGAILLRLFGAAVSRQADRPRRS